MLQYSCFITKVCYIAHPNLQDGGLKDDRPPRRAGNGRGGGGGGRSVSFKFAARPAASTRNGHGRGFQVQTFAAIRMQKTRDSEQCKGFAKSLSRRPALTANIQPARRNQLEADQSGPSPDSC